jgi:hypothetical protein
VSPNAGKMPLFKRAIGLLKTKCYLLAFDNLLSMDDTVEYSVRRRRTIIPELFLFLPQLFTTLKVLEMPCKWKLQLPRTHACDHAFLHSPAS